MKNFFDSIDDNYHSAYNSIIKVKSEIAKKSKIFYEKLYETYKKNGCEEANFLDGVKKQWYPRIWEMYFTCQLKGHNFQISCPKGNAPDIKLEVDNKTIWIECTVISKGENAVSEYHDGTVQELNDEDYILRITSAMKSKYIQIESHRKAGVIKDNDIVLIAINSGELMLTNVAQLDYPLIQKALYGVGQMTYNFTTEETKNLIRNEIINSNDSLINTNLFTTNDYEYISGVIFSNWKTTEIEKNLEDDFELTHNLFAKNKLPNSFFKMGIEYIPYEEKGLGGFEKINYIK